MCHMKCLPKTVLLLIVVALGLQTNTALPLQEPDASKADAMNDKIQLLRSRYDEGDAAPMEFEVREEEANAYLLLRLVDELPEGVIEPWVRFREGPVIAGALLDLDLLRERMPQSALTQYLSGRVPVELNARLQTGGGIGKILLESVSLGGIPLPSSFVQELVTTYTKSASRPDGIHLDEPFKLPYGVESLTVKKEMMLVKQGGAGRSPSSSHRD